jgi:hypothetical protein
MENKGITSQRTEYRTTLQMRKQLLPSTNQLTLKQPSPAMQTLFSARDEAEGEAKKRGEEMCLSCPARTGLLPVQ